MIRHLDYGRCVIAGGMCAGIVLAVQWLVGRAIQSGPLASFGDVYLGLTLLLLPFLGLFAGYAAAPSWGRPILARSFLANPALYYLTMLLPQLPPFAAPLSVEGLPALAWGGLVGCGVVWLTTLVGMWFGRYRTLALWACEKCGYDLTGLTSGRCPECGTDTGAT